MVNLNRCMRGDRMNFIEKHSKLLAFALCICASGPVLSTVHAYETKPGWHGEGADRYYILESNRQQATGLTEIDDELYYFNNEGEMQFGWQSISNETYYFESDGTAATGEKNIQGTVYNFQSEGALLHGWDEDGKSYYDDQGFKMTTSWIDDAGSKYYFDADGNLVKGWQEIDGKKYYFGDNGVMATGEVDIDGEKYFLGEDGVFQTGWINKDGQSFYYDEKGNPVKDASKDIDGKTYFFNESGEMLKDTEKDGYKIDGSGVATKDESINADKEETSKPAEQNQTQGSVQSGNQQTSKPSQPAPQPAPQPVPQPAPQPNYGVSSSAIANAALAQLGVHQDCTMLVTNSLAAVGINFHSAPEGYLSLGTITNNPVPGDIIVYSGHVAIYIGNGQAVHGGWLGYDTVISSVNCTNAFIAYVHVA